MEKLKKKPKSSSAKLYSYDDILLKTYIDVANTNDLTQLIIGDTSHTIDELTFQWETIVEANSKHSGNNRFSIYQNLIHDYAGLIASQTIVSASLSILFWRVDQEIINDCNNRGYVIDISSSEAYARSIKMAESRCKNLITKAESKRKEIERQFSERGKIQSLDDVIGFLELSLGRTILDADTMRLAKYNRLKKGE